MRPAFLVAVAAGVVAVAASVSPAAGGDAPFQRTCATHAEGPPGGPGPPYSRHDVRFGRLYFLGLDRRHRWTQRRGADGTLKIPVEIRSGGPVTIRITPLDHTRARLDFDPAQWRGEGRRVADGDGQRAVRFHPCPPDRRRFSDGGPLGPWTGYTGGFLVDRPGCARLTATATGMRTVRRRVAMGVAVSRCRA